MPRPVRGAGTDVAPPELAFVISWRFYKDVAPPELGGSRLNLHQRPARTPPDPHNFGAGGLAEHCCHRRGLLPVMDENYNSTP